MTDELSSLLESLESERGSERLQQLYDQLDESGLSQSELEDMVQEANQNETVAAFNSVESR